MANGPPPGVSLPTLTEVVELADSAARADPKSGAENALVQDVLAEVQQQLDLVLEQRLRAALAPLWARWADTLVQQAQADLSAALRDAVTHAVRQAMAARDRS